MIQIETPTQIPTGHASKHVGTPVIYVDKYGESHSAIITACWGPHLGENAVNLVYVSSDKTQVDPYGRQIKRESSVSPEGPHTAHGRYYRPV